MRLSLGDESTLDTSELKRVTAVGKTAYLEGPLANVRSELSELAGIYHSHEYSIAKKPNGAYAIRRLVGMGHRHLVLYLVFRRRRESSEWQSSAYDSVGSPYPTLLAESLTIDRTTEDS